MSESEKKDYAGEWQEFQSYFGTIFTFELK